jgi:hypothetical protein
MSYRGVAGLKPSHARTGNRGYLANLGSVRESSQSMNVEPRADSMRRACTQLGHSPPIESCCSKGVVGSFTDKE